MTDYHKLFEETTLTNSVFAQKSALDLLTPPDEIVARGGQQQKLATILNGIQEGYLLTTL